MPAPARRPEQEIPKTATGSTDWAAYLQQLLELEDADIAPIDLFVERREWAEKIAKRGIEMGSNAKGPLPAFPALAGKMLEILKRPEVDTHELVQLINQDPMIATHLLKVANSPLYSRGIEIQNVRQAVTRIGNKEVAALATAACSRSVFDLRTSQQRYRRILNDVWHHSMTTAFGVGWLAFEKRPDLYDTVFLGGLLHDIGKVLGVMALAAESTTAMPPEHMDQIIESVHVVLGKFMLKKWNLPEFLLDICEQHHKLNADPADTPVHLVRTVAFVDEIRRCPSSFRRLMPLLSQSFEALQLTPILLRALVSQHKQAMAKVDLLAS